MLDAVGRGRLLGFVFGARLYDDVDRWSHGGAETIYIDGEAYGDGGTEPAHIRGSGREDTFGTSYGGALRRPETHLYQGIPYHVHEDVSQARPAQRLAGYRWYEPDAITFERSLHFRFGCMTNDLCSTVYWYQDPPHRPFVRLPRRRCACLAPSCAAARWTSRRTRRTRASGGCAARSRTPAARGWPAGCGGAPSTASSTSRASSDRTSGACGPTGRPWPRP